MIEAGLERGSLNTGEIVEVLAELEIEVDQIEELYRELEAQGIEIKCAAAVLPLANTSAEDFHDRHAGGGDRTRSAGAVAGVNDIAVALFRA